MESMRQSPEGTVETGEPLYEQDLEEDRIDAMSQGATTAAMLLFAIPIAGFVLAVVWSFGGTQDPARRRLAGLNGALRGLTHGLQQSLAHRDMRQRCAALGAPLVVRGSQQTAVFAKMCHKILNCWRKMRVCPLRTSPSGSA